MSLSMFWTVALASAYPSATPAFWSQQPPPQQQRGNMQMDGQLGPGILQMQSFNLPGKASEQESFGMVMGGGPSQNGGIPSMLNNMQLRNQAPSGGMQQQPPPQSFDAQMAGHSSPNQMQDLAHLQSFDMMRPSANGGVEQQQNTFGAQRINDQFPSRGGDAQHDPFDLLGGGESSSRRQPQQDSVDMSIAVRSPPGEMQRQPFDFSMMSPPPGERQRNAFDRATIFPSPSTGLQGQVQNKQRDPFAMPIGGQASDGRPQQRDPFEVQMGVRASDGRPQQRDPFDMPMSGQSNDGRPQQRDPFAMQMGREASDGRPQQRDPFAMLMGGQASDGRRQQRDPFAVQMGGQASDGRQQQRDPFAMLMGGQASDGRPQQQRDPFGGPSNDGGPQQRDPFAMPMVGQASDGRPQQRDPFGGPSNDGRPQQRDPFAMQMGGQSSDGRSHDPFAMLMGGQAIDGRQQQRDPFATQMSAQATGAVQQRQQQQQDPFGMPMEGQGSGSMQQQQQQRDPFVMPMEGQGPDGRQQREYDHFDMPMAAQTFGESRQPRDLFEMSAGGQSSLERENQHDQSERNIIGHSGSRQVEQEQRNPFELHPEGENFGNGEERRYRLNRLMDATQQSGNGRKQRNSAKEDSPKPTEIIADKSFAPFTSDSQMQNERNLKMPVIDTPIESRQGSYTYQRPDKLLNPELQSHDHTDLVSGQNSESFVKEDPLQQRWVVDQNGVPETMADKAREHPAAPESSLQRSEDRDAQAVATYLDTGANATALLDWSRAWSALFPDAADRLLPGMRAELHKVVSDSLPRNTQAWSALSVAMQNEGLGCAEDMDRLCAQSDAVGCLVQLSAKSSAKCQRVLSPSLFGSCLGELPECALHFVHALPCLAKQADDGSDCSAALGKVHELRKSLASVLQEMFSQSDLRTEARSDVTTYAAWGFLFAICIAGVGVAANPGFSVKAWKFYDDHKSHLLAYRDTVSKFINRDGLLAKGDDPRTEERQEKEEEEEEASPEPESEQVGLLQ